jgi:hypothetical protein
MALIPLKEVRSLFTGRLGVCLPFSDAASHNFGFHKRVFARLPPVFKLARSIIYPRLDYQLNL